MTKDGKMMCAYLLLPRVIWKTSGEYYLQEKYADVLLETTKDSDEAGEVIDFAKDTIDNVISGLGGFFGCQSQAAYFLQYLEKRSLESLKKDETIKRYRKVLPHDVKIEEMEGVENTEQEDDVI